jgi:hypothetical protein
MSIADDVLGKLRNLPPEKQKEVLEFVEVLEASGESKPPYRSLEGLWAKYDINITEEDIAEMRREMWSNFPREFPKE